MDRDNQKSAVYNWENKIGKQFPDSRVDIGLDGATALIRGICREYGKEMPSIGDGRARRTACYKLSEHRIDLPRWARTPLVVCHETAHSLCGNKGGWHGPRFTNQVVELWALYCGIPESITRTIGTELRPRKVSF